MWRAVGLRQARHVRPGVLTTAATPRLLLALLVVGAFATACGDDEPAPATTSSPSPTPTAAATQGMMPEEWTEVSAADVTFDVPAGYAPVPDDTDGFAAGMWTGPPAGDGTRIGISIDVACTADPGDDAGAALDRFLAQPQWRGHTLLGRSETEVAGASSAARSVSRYVLSVAATGEDAEVTRHALMAVDEGVGALLLVQGVTEHFPAELAERVIGSVTFGAATEERVAACATTRDAGTPAVGET